MSERPAVQTVPGKLAAEISRVTALRAEYEAAGKACGMMGNFKPAIVLMTLSLDAAMVAANSPDVVEQVRALLDLQGWSK